jgi:hypothetical protein
MGKALMLIVSEGKSSMAARVNRDYQHRSFFMSARNPDYSGYERAKRLWIANKPNATPNEYQKAMRKLAARFGV